MTFGPESEFIPVGDISEITQRIIDENTEMYPEFLEGEHAMGKNTFNHWCGHCHAPGAMEHPGTIALRFKYDGTKIPEELEERTDLHPEAIITIVRAGTKSMPAFRRTEITNNELDALVEYLTRKSSF
jgi:mono/diheme cytochrome c family protein